MVNPKGRVVGIDMTQAMLEKARSRALKHESQDIQKTEAKLIGDFPFYSKLN